MTAEHEIMTIFKYIIMTKNEIISQKKKQDSTKAPQE